ncbi:hypothetical protein [Devosia sp.]|uniref:hypothetical protein n=1 Tax=Devosia sp. TaxID=1871048 RepID=UPI002931D90E|nr:hypothetical protein [Devosia sp.]
MTELTDLNDTDALNTAVSSQSVEGNVANMGGTDDVFQAILGMLSRFRNANIFRLRDNTDNTKLLAFNLSGLTTATTRTLTVPDRSGTFDVPTTALETGSKTILASERGTYFRKTGSAATWAPQAAATCGDGWAVTIKVEGEALTIDPQGAETIDGAATLVVPAGTTVRLWCNGTAFFSSFIAKPRVTGLFLNNGDELTFFKRGTLVHDFPSIAAQSYQSVDVAVTGATVTNQIAFANSNSIGDGLVLTARVFSTGTLRILVHNPTAAAIDPGNATLSWAIIG